MDTTIRNLDERAFRALKARAALEGKTVGEALNEAIHAWLRIDPAGQRQTSLRELRPVRWGARSKRSSESIDDVVYRGRR